MSVKLGNTNVSRILGSSGAATGTTDYTDLLNKPSINGITLAGNKTTSDLGITISTDDFYTKAETNNRINTAVTAGVQPKADKTYVDNQLALKVSNSALNSALALKSDKADTYTKTETNAEINSAMATKADISYVNTALDGKASLSDVYDKDEIDEQLDTIENSTNRSLATKADKDTTYTKTETDTAISTAIADRATTTYVDTGLATKANQETTYTKTEVDDLLSDMGPSGDTLPIGAIIPYSGQTTPENWLLCDGREVSRTTYNRLFNVIGTIYGAGDGSTSFNLPNLKDRVPVGTSNAITLGQTLGEKEHTLTVEEMPSHNHSVYVGNNITSQTNADKLMTGYLGSWPSETQQWNTRDTGGGQPHNIMQPSIGQNYIIKAKQSAGLVATVVDTLTSTSAVDALSANQGKALNNRLTNLETYSTNEQVVGKWINGKPIYRKVFTIDSVSTLNTDMSFPANIDNLDTVVDFKGMVYFENYSVPWNFYNWSNTSFAYIAFYRNDSIWYRINRAINSATFIMEYTKTTD